MRMPLFFGVLLASSWAAITHGSMITINNPGFEEPILPDGGSESFLFNSPSWQGALTIYNPTSALFPGEAPEGSNVATGAFVGQNLAVGVAPLSAYTLTVAVGHPQGFDFAGYNIRLLAGTTTLASITSDTGPLPNTGEFTDVSLTYLSPENNVPLGNFRIEINPLNVAAQSSFAFDNVRLTVEAVPEASTLALMTIPAGLFILGLRRRASQR